MFKSIVKACKCSKKDVQKSVSQVLRIRVKVVHKM